jgi:hypothetical protein
MKSLSSPGLIGNDVVWNLRHGTTGREELDLDVESTGC